MPLFLEFVWQQVLPLFSLGILTDIYFVVPTLTPVSPNVKKFVHWRLVEEMMSETKQKIAAKYKEERISMDEEAQKVSEQQERVDLTDLMANNWIWAYGPYILTVLDRVFVQWLTVTRWLELNPVLTWDPRCSLVLPVFEDDFVLWLPASITN